MRAVDVVTRGRLRIRLHMVCAILRVTWCHSSGRGPSRAFNDQAKRRSLCRAAGIPLCAGGLRLGMGEAFVNHVYVALRDSLSGGRRGGR